jgi:CBS domain-containing protein
MLISDVLHQKGRQVIKVSTTDTVLAAVRRLAENRIGAMVVEDAWMHPVGMFSERDFIRAVAAHGAAALDMTVESQMSGPITSCRLSDRVESALGVMTLSRFRHLPVIEDGVLVGMVSIGDLVKHRLDEKTLESDVLLEMTRMRA